MPDYRNAFPDFSPVTYLDCAYQGPFPRVTAERLRQAIEIQSHPDRLQSDEFFQLPDRVRARIARLVGADSSEISLTHSATQGIGIAAAGLEFSAGDEVVISRSNFPSNFFSWLHLQRKGVVVKVLDPGTRGVTPAQVAAALSPRTRVLALDWVNYSNGNRLDLAAFGGLTHDRGGIFVVDGTQGVGATELNLHRVPVDIMACAAYKFLLGPYGTAFAYVRKDLVGKLEVPVINWYSVEGADDFDALPGESFVLRREARIFDSGETANFINLHGLDASLEFMEDVTTRAAYEHCRRLLNRLTEGLRAYGYTLPGCGPGDESTILGFKTATTNETSTLHSKLRAQGIAVSLRHGVIRVSPYLYNDESDIERLLHAVNPKA